MEDTTCKNCRGEGLVGSGEQPWLRIGHVKTCPECSGTGKIQTENAAAETVASAPEGDEQPEVTSAAGEKIEQAVQESTDGVPVEGAGAVDEENATIKPEAAPLG